MTKRWMGLVFAGLVAGACGHATPTGSARNGWATPTGYANATDPNYINPDAAAHPAHNRSDFAKSEAPPPTQVAPPVDTTPQGGLPMPGDQPAPIAPEAIPPQPTEVPPSP